MTGPLQAIAELGKIPGPDEEENCDQNVEHIEQHSTLPRFYDERNVTLRPQQADYPAFAPLPPALLAADQDQGRGRKSSAHSLGYIAAVVNRYVRIRGQLVEAGDAGLSGTKRRYDRMIQIQRIGNDPEDNNSDESIQRAGERKGSCQCRGCLLFRSTDYIHDKLGRPFISNSGPVVTWDQVHLKDAHTSKLFSLA